VVSGYASGKALTEVRDENNLLVTATADAAQYQHCLVPTSSALVFLHPKASTSQFALYLWAGDSEDLTLQQDLGELVSQTIGAQWTSGNTLRAMVDDAADTLWVMHGDQSKVFVLFLKSRQWVSFTFDFTLSGFSFVNGQTYLFTTSGGVYTYNHGTISSSADSTVKTKKLRIDPFNRFRLKEFIWLVEEDNFTGKVTISSELESVEQSVFIKGDPPKPMRVRGVDDTGIAFKLNDVKIDSLAPVGEIICRVAENGRPLNE
jgi:hypothetical protein